jgi:ferredoxin--NADP+ reductase
MPQELNAVVIQKIEHAPGLMTMRVVPDGWELKGFTAGQFVVLGLPGAAPRCPQSDPHDPKPVDPDKLIRRAYSITSASVVNEYLEFYISLVRSGELTPRLFNLGIGDRLWLSGKCTGYFTLAEVPAGNNVILVATGTGLAPYMSMIRSELGSDHLQRFAVIHGAYHSWDLGYHAELVTLERISRKFNYIPVVSNPEEEPVLWKGQTGFVQAVWQGGLVERHWGFCPTPENTHVFLCGHPEMIKSMEQIIQQEGFVEHTRKSPGHYHVERYF